MKLVKLAIGVLLLVTLPAFAEKKLEWQRMSVNAQLDSAGQMVVSERLTMRFTGDWNGGERVFRVEPGQDFSFEGMSRIAPDGKTTEMSSGSLSLLDHYELEGTRLRWRSRLASDPAFDGTVITYELRYRLAKILVPAPSGSGYQLRHDFAFEGRDEPIQDFDLHLTFAPEWRHDPIAMSKSNVGKRDGVVIFVDLAYAGATQPQARAWYVALLATVHTWHVILPSALLLAAFLLSYALAVSRSRGVIDEVWLHDHVFRYPPEVAGALFDGKVEGAEVAAMLAQMEMDGVISSELAKSGEDLQLELKVPRKELTGRASDLVHAIFKGEKTKVNTKTLRNGSQRSGFDLPAAIRKSVMEDVNTLTGLRADSQRTVSALVGASVISVVAAIYQNPKEFVLIFLLAFGGLGVLALGYVMSEAWLAKRGGASTLKLVIPGAAMWLLTATCQRAARGEGVQNGFSALGLLSVALLLAAVYRLFLSWASAGLPWRGMVIQQRLIRAREWFAAQLESDAPPLDDRWMPWLIALGLSPEVDKWWKAYSPARSAVARAGTAGDNDAFSTMSSSTESTPDRSFTGGGGRFGGAGATGGWGAAATAFAAPIPAAGSGRSSSSSSSSDSSSSWSSSSDSSSSSSGGGSGGGW